jgi:hypothetical protein
MKRMIVMSSNSPIGFNPSPDHRFDEESPYQSYMGYGRSKMRMEQALPSRTQKLGWPEIVTALPGSMALASRRGKRCSSR